MSAHRPWAQTASQSQVFGGNVLKQIIKCNMQMLYSLLISSLPVWDAEEDKIRQLFILSRQQVSPIQSDFR